MAPKKRKIVVCVNAIDNKFYKLKAREAGTAFVTTICWTASLNILFEIDSRSASAPTVIPNTQI
jgi:hypothetical protein